METTRFGKFLDEDDKQPRYYEVNHPASLVRLYDPIVKPAYFKINVIVEDESLNQVPQIFTVFPNLSSV